MRCLVTGATGHLGCSLVRALCRKGVEVVAYVRKSSRLEALSGLPISYAYGDITDQTALSCALLQCDVLYHIAGIVDIGVGHACEMERVNVGGAKLAADLCLAQQKRMVYMSSVHAIAELPMGQTMREVSSFSPTLVHGSYSKTKAEATAYVYGLTKEGLDAVILHPSGIIGPYEFRISNLGQFIISFARGKLPAYIDGMYNFVDVRDVAEAAINAGEKSLPAQCYLLTGHIVTVKELFDMLSRITGRKAPAFKAPYFLARLAVPFAMLFSSVAKRPPLFTNYALSTLQSNPHFCSEKAKKELGFSPRPIYDTLSDTYLWLTAHHKI